MFERRFLGLCGFTKADQEFWRYPSGQHCFQLDVQEKPPWTPPQLR